MNKNNWNWIIIIAVILITVISISNQTQFQKKLAGETVSWSAASAFITTGGTLTITASPSSTAAVKSWAVENVAIPSGWTLQSAVFSGGSGLGASGCRVESGKLDCATAGDFPADVATTLTIRFTAPVAATNPVPFNGAYTIINTNGVQTNGNLPSIQITFQSTGCTADSGCSYLNSDCKTGICSSGTCTTQNKASGTSCSGGTRLNGECNIPTTLSCTTAGGTRCKASPCSSFNSCSAVSGTFTNCAYCCSGDCTIPRATQTCSLLGGTSCQPGQNCIGGAYQTATDTSSCCVSGTCTTTPISSCKPWEKSTNTGCKTAEWIYIPVALIGIIIFLRFVKIKKFR